MSMVLIGQNFTEKKLLTHEHGFNWVKILRGKFH